MGFREFSLGFIVFGVRGLYYFRLLWATHLMLPTAVFCVTYYGRWVLVYKFLQVIGLGLSRGSRFNLKVLILRSHWFSLRIRWFR
jgi:hypothetical protein